MMSHRAFESQSCPQQSPSQRTARAVHTNTCYTTTTTTAVASEALRRLCTRQSLERDGAVAAEAVHMGHPPTRKKKKKKKKKKSSRSPTLLSAPLLHRLVALLLSLLVVAFVPLACHAEEQDYYDSRGTLPGNIGAPAVAVASTSAVPAAAASADAEEDDDDEAEEEALQQALLVWQRRQRQRQRQLASAASTNETSPPATASEFVRVDGVHFMARRMRESQTLNPRHENEHPRHIKKYK